jgi:hypothetical protein
MRHARDLRTERPADGVHDVRTHALTLQAGYMDAAVVRTCLVAISVCAVAAGVSAQRGAPKVDEILLRAGTFVQDTANSLTGVIADESYEQDLLGPLFDGGTRPRIGRRSMQGEALFMWLPAANEWMFVRNVLAVDDRPVPDSGERLDRLFKDSAIETSAYLRQLQEENARFDIGPVVRTLGDPTFALRYLEPGSQARFAFSRIDTERIGDVRATVLVFSERRRPFVVKVDGMDAQSAGKVWIDAAGGAVLRTNLRVTRPSGRGSIASVTVSFQKDARLGIWVPSMMSEQYNAMDGKTTIGTASYSNFRRFDTSVRVVAPEAQN